MDNFAAAAALKGGADAAMADAAPPPVANAANADAANADAAMADAAPPAPPAPSDIDRIAAALGYEMCSDSDDDDDEALPLVAAPASAHAEWADEDAELDAVPRTEHEILAPPPPPRLGEIVIGAAGALRPVGVVEHVAAADLTVVVRGAADAAAVVEDTALCLGDPCAPKLTLLA